MRAGMKNKLEGEYLTSHRKNMSNALKHQTKVEGALSPLSHCWGDVPLLSTASCASVTPGPILAIESDTG